MLFVHHQAHFDEFLAYWPEYSENKLKVAWKKTKKGKFSVKKEPPKSWRDRQLNERQKRVEMYHEMVRLSFSHICCRSELVGVLPFTDPAFCGCSQERSDSEGGRSRSSSLAT